MKTIVEINGSNYGSTGNISLNISNEALKNGFNAYTFVSTSRESKKHSFPNQIYFGNWLERIISERISYITGIHDRFNLLGTIDLIKKIKNIKPDLIHLHLLHDDFLNINLLFSFLKKLNIPIIWTFHDCWPMTGHCPAFDMINCQKWKTQCMNCELYKNDPKTLFFDTSKSGYRNKKELFSNFNNLTVVTPSKWLSSIVKESYFKKYNILTIYNGLDLKKFYKRDFNYKEKLNIKDKYFILGVANYWNKRKGLDVFIKLAKQLPENYQIVLVGTNNEVDKILPPNIISIHRTFDQNELAQIYSSADLFVNPTREDVFGLVNVEALACGTPVIVFKTGGCTEIVDNTCGSVVEKNDVVNLKNEIIRLCEKNQIKEKNCFDRAKQFDKNLTYKAYIDLYKEKLNIR